MTFILSIFWGMTAMAQDAFWIQLEANATLAQGETVTRDYDARLDDVNGFRLGASGWYATVLGPFTEDEATARLTSLLALGTIPRDAYVSDGAAYAQQFWPVGANTLATRDAEGPQTDGDAGTEDDTQTSVIAEPEPEPEPEETRGEALASERTLDREQREALQIALQFDGYYTAAIDGAIGPGTRNAMAQWQTAKGYEATGVLTTRQRAELLGDYEAVFDSLGLASITDAGIEIIIPTAMVSFDHYEAPFAHYEGDEGVRVVLISQSGGQSTLYGLYDILQSLEVVPPEGERQRRESDFTIEGANSQITSYTHAAIVDGAVKGYMLIWPVGDEKRRNIALDAMKDSFTSVGGVVLDDNAGLDEAMQSVDLVSGLEIRRADRARTGFYVGGEGAVLTTADAVAGCGQISLDESYPAQVVATDSAFGLALLQPEQTLAPLAVATLSTDEPRIQSDLAVAGFSFGGRLSSATLTYGKLADIKGLDGEDTVFRLDLAAQDGDAGGPLINANGAVLGMLQSDATNANRQFPDEVSFAAKASALAEFLTTNGIEARTGGDSMSTLTPHALATQAADMSVLVSCWE